MPRKVRQLKADLSKAGFTWRTRQGQPYCLGPPPHPDQGSHHFRQRRRRCQALSRARSARGACCFEAGQSTAKEEAALSEQEDYLHYSMTIEWDPEDQIYVARVPELPGCVTHGKTYEEAVRQGQDAIESWIEAARAWGNPIPPPRVAAPQR